MISSPCWSCNGAGRPGCTTCGGTGRYRTHRLDAWARRKLFLGTPRTKAEKALVDASGNEKWTRYSAEVPPEFDELLAQAAKRSGHQGKLDRAAITRVALFHFLDQQVPEEAAIEGTADDVVVLPALPRGENSDGR